MKTRSSGGSFGLVVLLIVGLIVALLTAKSWLAVGSKAVEVSTPEKVERDAVRAAMPVETMPVGSPGTAARPFSPNMAAMQAATDAHSAAVQGAMQSTGGDAPATPPSE